MTVRYFTIDRRGEALERASAAPLQRLIDRAGDDIELGLIWAHVPDPRHGDDHGPVTAREITTDLMGGVREAVRLAVARLAVAPFERHPRAVCVQAYCPHVNAAGIAHYLEVVGADHDPPIAEQVAQRDPGWFLEILVIPW